MTSRRFDSFKGLDRSLWFSFEWREMMENLDYPALSIDALLEQFRNACLAQYESDFTDDIKCYNDNAEIIGAIRKELKARGPEARRSLLRLFNDDNPQVWLQAATSVYAVAPEPARAMLEEIKAMNIPDQSLSAGMTLRRLAEVPNCLDD